MKRRTIAGQDHWQYAARITHDPNTGRPILEVLQDDDEVLVKDGSAFCTFWSAMELPRVTPSAIEDLASEIEQRMADGLQYDEGDMDDLAEDAGDSWPDDQGDDHDG